MLTNLLRVQVERVALPLGRALGNVGVTANAMTVAGLLIVAVGCLQIARGRLLAGGLILAAGTLFDTMDGSVARAMGNESQAEAFLDSTLDRVADGMIFSALAWHLAGRSQVGFGLALAAGILAFLTSYIKARAEAARLTCNVGLAERWLRVVLVEAGLLFGVLLPALGTLAVLSAITVVQRFVHVFRQAAG